METDAVVVVAVALGPPLVASRGFVPVELATLRSLPLDWWAPAAPFFSFAFGVSDLESSWAVREDFAGAILC